MKKQIITGIAVIACVALCASVWPRNAEVGDLPAEPAKTAVFTKIEASQKEVPPIILSEDTPVAEPKTVEENGPTKNEVIKAEEKTQPSAPSKQASPPVETSKSSAQPSSSQKSGDRAIIDGKPHIWVPGFGWIEDHGGGSIGITIDGEGDINKQVGVMGGGTTVGNPGDELTGNKVGIMGGGTVAEDMYENGHKIGIMGGNESSSSEATPPPSKQPEPVDGEILIVFLEVPEKNSIPPPYKPNTTPPTNP
ncbi:MAG: DUF6550 family protein [Thermincola sp.]|nr:DUF6550 family protein [Thermincola sp.]MDT3702352.1 DUF6550 family protein [Thermincola sp.]